MVFTPQHTPFRRSPSGRSTLHVVDVVVGAIRTPVNKEDITNGQYLQFEIDEEDGVEKIGLASMDKYSEFLSAMIPALPGPAPAKSVLTDAWLQVDAALVPAHAKERFASEEALKTSMLWSYAWNNYKNHKHRRSKSMKVMRFGMQLTKHLQ